MNRQIWESAKSANSIWALIKTTAVRKVFRGECLIDSFVVRPVWMPPSARLNMCIRQKDLLATKTFSTPGSFENTLDWSSCTADLIPLTEWRGIRLAACGSNLENNYQLINDLYGGPPELIWGAKKRLWAWMAFILVWIFLLGHFPVKMSLHDEYYLRP